MTNIQTLDRGYRIGDQVHVRMEDGSTPWAEVIYAKNVPTARAPQNWIMRVRVYLETPSGGFREYTLSAPGGTPSQTVVVLIEA